MSEQDPNKHFVGKVVRAVSAKCEAKMTEPPERYTQDSLVSDMLSAHKFAKNEQERAVLKETEGLGTSRTREPTITDLIRRGFLDSKKKGKRHEVISSDLARKTIDGLPDVLTGVGTTARWEAAFKLVERGKATPAQIREHLKANLDHIVGIAKSSKGKMEISAPAQKSFTQARSTPKAPSVPGKSPSDSGGAAKKTSVVGGIKKWF